MTATDPRTKRFLRLLYLAGLFIFADQVIDVAANLLSNPVRPEAVTWRFGVFGLLATRATTLLVADVMLFTAAVGLGHVMVLRILGALHLILAAAVGVALVLFVLDMLEIRRLVSEGAARRYDSAAMRAAVIAALGVGIMAWGGVAAVRTGLKSSAKRRRKVAPLIEEEPSEPA